MGIENLISIKIKALLLAQRARNALIKYLEEISVIKRKLKLVPTTEQLKTFFRICVRASNLLRNIELTRYDTRSQRIVVLIGTEIQVEILSNGEEIIQ